MQREIAWTKYDGRAIAYEVIGEGPPDILLVDDWFTNLDLDWEDPYRARMLRLIAASARVIRFDKSGMGLSDRMPPSPPTAMQTWADEAIAVLDAVGVGTVRLLAGAWSGPLGVTLAARHPDRFDRVAFATAFARLRTRDDLECVAPELVDAARQIILDNWGTGIVTLVLGQSRDELPQHQLELDCRYERGAVAPRDLAAVVDALYLADPVASLPSITALTLVAHRTNPLLPVAHAHGLAAAIPNARVAIVEETDWYYRLTEDDLFADVLMAVAFLTDSNTERELSHQLVTMVFLDIVDSTGLIGRRGDREWSGLLEQFTVALQTQLTHYKGRLVDSAGDGFFTVFDSPRRAIRFALQVAHDAAALGVSLRAGVHTGECHVERDDLRGMAVHATARIMAHASAHEVLVSDAVRVLLNSEPFTFTSLGAHDLRGVPGLWDLYEVGE